MDRPVAMAAFRNEKNFVEKVLPLEYISKGILPSEGFAFCSIAKALDVDRIIESGVYMGQSTSIWTKFFAPNDVYSIDKVLLPALGKRFKDTSNVHFRNGDGAKLIPGMIADNLKHRLGIFIDGPKGKQAIELAKICFQQPNVFVVAIHDAHAVSKGELNPSRVMMADEPIFRFFSDDFEFLLEYAYMDVPPHCLGHGNEDEYWAPGELISKSKPKKKSFGSYGPTIAIAFKGLGE